MNAQYTGKKIAELRKGKGLTQKDIAERLHVSVAAVSKWERGLNFPDLMLTEPLSEILGITVSELLGLEGRSADRIIQDIAELSGNEMTLKKKRLIKSALLILVSVALFIAIYLAVYMSVKDNSFWRSLFEFRIIGILNPLSAVLSLAAIALAVTSIFTCKEKWIAFSFTSLICCSSAMLIPTLVTYLTIRFEYLSTVEDVIGGDLFAFTVVFFATVIFNVCSFLIHKKL